MQWVFGRKTPLGGPVGGYRFLSMDDGFATRPQKISSAIYAIDDFNENGKADLRQSSIKVHDVRLDVGEPVSRTAAWDRPNAS